MWEVCCNTAKIYKHSRPRTRTRIFQSATKPTTTEQTVAAKTTKQNCEKWSGKIHESQFFMEEWQKTNLENKIYDMIETVSLYNLCFFFALSMLFICVVVFLLSFGKMGFGTRISTWALECNVKMSLLINFWLMLLICSWRHSADLQNWILWLSSTIANFRSPNSKFP